MFTATDESKPGPKLKVGIMLRKIYTEVRLGTSRQKTKKPTGYGQVVSVCMKCLERTVVLTYGL